MLEYLTSFKRDCDKVSEEANASDGVPLEYLTSFKRDCDILFIPKPNGSTYLVGILDLI